jgi:Cu+-exporting ATPase
MTVDPAGAKGQHDHLGTTYYFCAPACHARFVADPARYLAPGYRAAGMGGGLVSLGKPRLSRPAAPPSGPRYVCPMDPEVSSPLPAACPKCGMALEPEAITLDEKPDPELANMTRRFWVALVLAAPLFLYGMAEMIGRPSSDAIPARARAGRAFAGNGPGDARRVLGRLALARSRVEFSAQRSPTCSP